MKYLLLGINIALGVMPYGANTTFFVKSATTRRKQVAETH
jgi:hypothetical protein